MALHAGTALATASFVMIAAAGIQGGEATAFAPHIRSAARPLVDLVAEGADRSATFRSLVERLDASNLVVYLEYALLRRYGLAGQLTFISAAGGRRYVRVQIDWHQPRSLQLAVLGHELQHAVEIAGSPEVNDISSMARYYARVGIDRSVGGGGRRFDTHTAIDTGRRVYRELTTAVANGAVHARVPRHGSKDGLADSASFRRNSP